MYDGMVDLMTGRQCSIMESDSLNLFKVIIQEVTFVNANTRCKWGLNAAKVYSRKSI